MLATKYILLICIAALALPGVGYAQNVLDGGYYDGSFYYELIGYTEIKSHYTDFVWKRPEIRPERGTGNTCNMAYFNAAGKNKMPLFGSVTAKMYEAKDSTLINKKLYEKLKVTFTKWGQEELVVEWDSLGRVVDSIRYAYNAKHDNIRTTGYRMLGKPATLQKSYDEYSAYDNKERLIKDSAWQKTSRHYAAFDTVFVKFQSEFFSYNDSDAIIQYRVYSNEDTIKDDMDIDYKNRTMRQNEYNNGRFSKHYTRWDSAGKMVDRIDSVFMVDIDTREYKTFYDNKERRTAWQRFENGKIQEMQTEKYNVDGSDVETDEKFSDNTGPSCPNDSKTISTWNKDGLMLSEVETTEKEGKSIVTSTEHFYKLDGDKVLLDSSVTTETGDLYSSTTINLYSKKYDSKGKVTEEMEDGERQSRCERTFNKKENLLTEYNYSCSGKPDKADSNVYYSDDETVKLHYSLTSWGKRSYNYIGNTGRFIRDVEITGNSAEEITYDYTR